jgi:hypothetical protein
MDMIIDRIFKDIDKNKKKTKKVKEIQFTTDDKKEMPLYRLENLLTRRPFLLSNALLR